MLTYSALQGKGIRETQINLRTGVPCRHARCAFCSVKDKEENRGKSLTYDELHAQTSAAFADNRNQKLVLVSNTHSVFTQDIVECGALRQLVCALSALGIPEITLETRLDLVIDMQNALTRLNDPIPGVRRPAIEIAAGIETPDEYERNRILQKNLSNDTIAEAAAILFNLGIGLRTYVIYRHPLSGNDGSFRIELEKLQNMLEFLGEIKAGTKGNVSLYVIPGYGTASAPEFMPPALNEVAEAMHETSGMAKQLNIPMILDPVEDDICMISSGTVRKIDRTLRAEIENRNFFGWR